ncbi:transporter substrate-binding domain-containing protein [Ancylobacter sp. MQZ15Z-1]|uniref:Transporter substrate-binding domain-containing protein n=1 Tax=Ancylobacter mangrovi TaxID=2972472 RepID=A0A9X2T7A0_9HYPH|nr:transporter substrate-binding domain-containing protein [Ancylobacter mangrovi]MCS0497289.1 transporter substrate-binding domain-containing protein [Ancylobacter mangrovi]
MMSLTRRAFGLTLLGGAAVAALGTAPAFAETTLERIRRTKKLTVGTEAAFPPFEFVEDGKIVGYGKDILNVVVADLDVELNQLDVPFQGILPGVLAGKFDFVATSVGINEERAKKYAFTLPIAESTPYFIKRAGDASISSGADLNGKVVGTQLGTTTEQAARATNAKLKKAGGKGFSDLKLYPSFPETYLALANGEVDVVVQSLPNAAVLIKQQPGVFALAGPASETISYMGWVTRPEDKDLRDYISGVIRQLRDSGKLYAFQDKWFGFRMPIPDSGYLPPGAV